MKTVVIFCLFCLSASVLASDRLVVFGDSYVDGGNVFAVSFGWFPSDSKMKTTGRFTHGLAYPDLLAKKYGIEAYLPSMGKTCTAEECLTPSVRGGRNYAYGGATTTSNVSRQLAMFVYTGFDDQVAFYLNDGLNPEAVHVVGIGLNDLLVAAFKIGNDSLATGEIDSQQVTTEINKIVAGIVIQLEKLVAAGVSPKRLLLANAPKLSQLPRIQKVAKSNEALILAADAMTEQYNAALLDALSKAKLSLEVIDLYAVFDQNIGANNRLLSGEQAFVDDLHPSEALHQLIADSIRVSL